MSGSVTGRRAIGTLLRHYDRTRKTDAGFYPLVKLRVGGFNHRDERIGWVSTPVFAVVGRTPREDLSGSAKVGPAGNAQAEFNDAIPY